MLVENIIVNAFGKDLKEGVMSLAIGDFARLPYERTRLNSSRLHHSRNRAPDPDERMPPIITIDTAPSPFYIDAHHSTHTFTTLLNDDQLILVEVQGTLEYTLKDGTKQGDIKLGDISWDTAVYLI